MTGYLPVFAFLAAALVQLCGCGGGGGESPPPQAPVDTAAPQIHLDTPVDGSLTNQREQLFTGRLNEPAVLRINDAPANVDAGGAFRFGPVTLAEGSNRFALVATDAAGNSTRLDVTLVLDTVAPDMANSGLITRSTPGGAGIAVLGRAGSVEAGALVELANVRSGDAGAVSADADGAFSAEIAGQADDVLRIVVRDGAGNRSEPLVLQAPDPPDWRFGVIGDSMAAATHSDDMCGAGNELLNCLRKRLGHHDTPWSYAAGDKPWSLGALAGFNPAAVISAATDGAEWKDALGQAQRILQSETGTEQVRELFIGLGANDVCAPFGHVYDGDLERIAQHIDNTLTYLTDALAGRDGARIALSGTPDIVQFRDVMYERRHNIAFSSCQALWDLDVNALQAEARESLCKGELGTGCDALPANLESELLDAFLDSLFDQNDVDEGPCGRVLNSANSDLDRAGAYAFNVALNALIAQKAAAYDQRNGVRVRFSDALFEMTIEPWMVSQLDCFHPSRAGQLAIAQTLWQDLEAGHARSDSYYFDAFENPDKCVQEFTDWGGQCWVDGGAASGFDSLIASDGWYRLLKDTDNNESHWVERSVGDLSEKSAAWLSFRHRRVGLDDSGDRVDVLVYDADGGEGRAPGWVLLDRFAGPGIDVGVHNGAYYDLTPVLSAEMKIRFQTNNARSMENGDGLQWDNVSLFAW